LRNCSKKMCCKL